MWQRELQGYNPGCVLKVRRLMLDIEIGTYTIMQRACALEAKVGAVSKIGGHFLIHTPGRRYRMSAID